MQRCEAIDRIKALEDDFHEAGILEGEALEYLIGEARNRRIEHSAETGCGVTTLVMSWFSNEHSVFTLARYGEIPCKSYENVRSSSLLKPATVEFHPGPTQLTLPPHRFENSLDLVILDGPHGFPYPQLEYYYFYPHIAPGGLLVVDDIHIPTVRWLHDFLVHDAMFDFRERVGNTSFFQRTEYETFDPLGDGWWEQGYNRRHFKDQPSFRDTVSGLIRRLGGLASRISRLPR